MNDNQKHNMYIDVTQLVHWDGRLTGIPRVMYELATRFDAHNVVYVSWVKEVGSYCEIDFEHSVINRHGVKYINSAEASTTSPAPHKQSKLLSVGKKALKKAVRVTRVIDSDLPDKIHRAFVAKKAEHYKKVILNDGDSVFIPWGEWWDGDFLKMLEESHSRGARVSTFIHDVGPMVAPHLTSNSASLADYCQRIVPLCRVVFVNSLFTKETLITWLQENHLKVPDIDVVTLGDDFKHSIAKKPDHELLKEGKVQQKNFILTVGTIELKKNHIFYYYVYKLAMERGIELPPLVIAGRRGWSTETNITLMQTDPSLKDKIIFLFDTSDEELAWLYKNAKFTLFASMYEGWGLPLAESLFHGVPVVSARSTSLVEIGDGLIDRFTQYSTDECLARCQDMLDNKYLKSKIELVKSYQPAMWDVCYQDIVQKLQEKEMI